MFLPELIAAGFLVFGGFIYFYADWVIERRIKRWEKFQRYEEDAKALCKYYADMFLLISGALLTLVALVKTLVVCPEGWRLKMGVLLGFYILGWVMLLGLFYGDQARLLSVKVGDYSKKYKFVPTGSRRWVWFARLGLVVLNGALVAIQEYAR